MRRKQPKLNSVAYSFSQLVFRQPYSSRGHPESSDLKDLRTALAAQSSQNKAPGLGRAGSGYGFLTSGLHALVVIVLPGQDFAVWVIPGREVARVIVTATLVIYMAP